MLDPRARKDAESGSLKNLRQLLGSGHNNHIEASLRLQESPFYVQKWLKKWRIGVNEAKSVQVTFIIRRETCR